MQEGQWTLLHCYAFPVKMPGKGLQNFEKYLSYMEGNLNFEVRMHTRSKTESKYEVKFQSNLLVWSIEWMKYVMLCLYLFFYSSVVCCGVIHPDLNFSLSFAFCFWMLPFYLFFYCLMKCSSMFVNYAVVSLCNSWVYISFKMKLGSYYF